MSVHKKTVVQARKQRSKIRYLGKRVREGWATALKDKNSKASLKIQARWEEVQEKAKKSGGHEVVEFALKRHEGATGRSKGGFCVKCRSSFEELAEDYRRAGTCKQFKWSSNMDHHLIKPRQIDLLKWEGYGNKLETFAEFFGMQPNEVEW